MQGNWSHFIIIQSDKKYVEEKYNLIFDEVWKEQWKRLDSGTKERILKIFSRLEVDPYHVGNPLHYAGGRLREARVGNYRLYFTIVEKSVEILKLVIILELGHKDEQIKLIRRLASQLASKITFIVGKLKLRKSDS